MPGAGVPREGLTDRARVFLGRMVEKAADDNIFFMAGAITFNILVAIVPLILLAMGIAALALNARSGDTAARASEVVLPLIFRNIPTTGEELHLVETVRGAIQGVVRDVLGEGVNLSLLGAVILIWISTRLVGTLRTVLREVFDVGEDRGIVRGKIFDAQIVVVTGLLFLANFAGTVALDFLRDFGIQLLGLEGWSLRVTEAFYTRALAIFSLWMMFFLIYRYLPPRRIGARTVMVAATFTTVFVELAKAAFSWYVTEVANYTTAYGNLATAAILFFWVYYSAIIFILGGGVAQLAAIGRARREQRARLAGSAG